MEGLPVLFILLSLVSKEFKIQFVGPSNFVHLSFSHFKIIQNKHVIMIYIFVALYNVIKKWAKTDKVKIPCLKLMCTLVCFGSSTFVTEKANDVQSMVLTSMKVRHYAVLVHSVRKPR